LTDIDPTPKKNERAKLRRSYAIPDISAPASDAAESEYEPQVSNDEYEPQVQPESQDHAADEDFYDDEPTLKKKQKMFKVPVRQAINANRKEPESRKAENKASHPVLIADEKPTITCLGL
jgi:hypothetical protein